MQAMGRKTIQIFLLGVSMFVANGWAGDLFFIGTHGSRGPSTAESIFSARFDEQTGQISALQGVAKIEHPTWLAVHPTLPVLYAVNELGNDGRSEASIYSFAIDREHDTLRQLNARGSGGGGVTYLALVPGLNYIFGAHFGGGQVSSLALLPDGELGPITSLQRDYGSGPNRRQQAPHAHGIALSPDHRFVLVADMGADRLFIYRFDAKNGLLTPSAPAYEALPAGTGPRHLAFHPNGQWLFLISELSSEVRSYRWSATQGTLSLVQTLPTSSPNFHGEKSGGGIIVSHDGRFLYVSDRGENTLVAYQIDAATGQLREIQRLASQGQTPWSFSLSPDEHWLLVANMGTNTIDVLKRNNETGRLESTSARISVPSPVNITFASH